MATVNLPRPYARYDEAAERRRNEVLETELNDRVARFDDIETTVNRIILTSPDGKRWVLEVGNTGAVSSTELL